MELKDYVEIQEYHRAGRGGDKWMDQYHLRGNKVYYEDRRVLHKGEVEDVLAQFHDHPTAAHQNGITMLQHIKKRYVWPEMTENVREYTKSCWECQQRGNAKQNNPKITIRPEGLFERWGVDIVGPLPLSARKNKYVIVAMDYFSRWPEAKALKVANAETTTQFIYERIICRYGTPSIIQSDQGTNFVNKVIAQLTEKFRIRHKKSSPYHPQSNGLVERFNRSLCEGIAKVTEEIEEWDDYIQPILFAYRVKELRILGTSPYKIIYGKDPMLAGDKPKETQTLMERLKEITTGVPTLRKEAQQVMLEAQQKLENAFQGKTHRFNKGELVWYFDKAKAARHDTKLEPKWKGPYEISQVLDKGAYRLKIDGKEIRSTVNGNLLKPYHGRSGWQPIVVIEDINTPVLLT